MGVIDSLYSRIDSGRAGNNIGIPTGMDDLDKITYGIQRGFMTTIFGDQGAGKTTYTLFTHVYKPLQYALQHPNIPVEILYFSLEMSPEVLLAKLLSLYIFDTYKETVSYKEILSLGEILDGEKYKLICEARSWLERIINHLTIYDKAVTAEGVLTIVKNWASNFGTFDGEDTYIDVYTPKNPNIYKIVVIDHMRLISGSDKRAEINKTADYMILMRDLCNLTIALVQQANRQMKSMERRTGGFQYLQIDDIADASGSAQGSEVIIGIYYPHREKRSNCEGYDIKRLRDGCRIIQILKHRYGVSDVMKGVLFRGEIGYYKELPNPDKGTLNYDEILDIKYLYPDSANLNAKEQYSDNEREINVVNDSTSTEELFNMGNIININYNFD